VHREPDVLLTGELDRPGVDPHSDPDLDRWRPALGAERLLRRDRRENRVAGSRERDEEGVPVRVDHAAAVVGEGVAQDALLPSLNRGKVVAELTKQSRGAFDVGEKEGQRPACLLGHAGYSGG
jgi:hypothetical protein